MAKGTVIISGSDEAQTVGASQLTGALTVGVDDTGHDVTVFWCCSWCLLWYVESNLLMHWNLEAPLQRQENFLLSTAEAICRRWKQIRTN